MEKNKKKAVANKNILSEGFSERGKIPIISLDNKERKALAEAILTSTLSIKKRASISSYLPLALLPESKSSTKKQSITIKEADLALKVAEKHRWSMNELVNYALELFIFSFFDTNANKDVFIEASCFQEVKNFAAMNKMKEGEVIRYATEVFSRLLQDGILDRALNTKEVKTGAQSLPGLISRLLDDGLQKYE